MSSSCFKEEEELEGEREEQEEQTQEYVTPRRKDRMSRSGAVAKVLLHFLHCTVMKAILRDLVRYSPRPVVCTIPSVMTPMRKR